MLLSFKLPEFRGRTYTRGGILPFFHSKFSKIIAGKIQQIYSENLKNEQYSCIFTPNFNKSLEPKEWAKDITTLASDCLEISYLFLKPSNKELITYEPKMNNMLYYFIKEFKYLCKLNKGDIEDIILDCLIGLEPVRDETITSFSNPCFSYFVGKHEKNNSSLINTAIIGLKEYGHIIYSSSIINDQYQKKIRNKYNCLFVPIFIDVQYKNTNLFSRVYIVMTDENIELTDIEFNNNKYIYIDVIFQDYNL